MIVTPEGNRRNQRQALMAAGLVALAAGLLGWLVPCSMDAARGESVHVLVAAAAVSPTDRGDAAAVSGPVGADSSHPRDLLRGA